MSLWLGPGLALPFKNSWAFLIVAFCYAYTSYCFDRGSTHLSGEGPWIQNDLLLSSSPFFLAACVLAICKNERGCLRS
jgi:hypothetical protein